MTDVRQVRDGASPYDAIAELYDPWSRSVTEDVDFYVAEARKAGGPVVELGIGTGRIAIPIAQKGVQVIGVDSSHEMLAACRRRAEAEGVTELLDLRLGDLRAPPVDEPVPLVICPFRSYLHLADDGERVDALTAARAALRPDGRLVFDVFAPKPDDIEETHGRWLEREPGIYERADWDENARTLSSPSAAPRARRRCRSPGSHARNGSGSSRKPASTSRPARLVRPHSIPRRRGHGLRRQGC